MVTNTEDLEQTLQEVVSYLKQQGFAIFYGFEFPETRYFAEMQWDDQNHEWKAFLEATREAGSKIIVLEIHRFKEDDLHRFLPRVEQEETAPAEDADKLRKYLGKLCQLGLIWCKDGVKYSFTRTTDWWDALMEQETQKESEVEAKKAEISNDVKSKSVEQLAEELLAFIREEFPESETRVGPPYEAERLFWETKGLRSPFVEDPEIRIKMERTEILARSILEQEVQKREKELIPELVEQCVKWARENGLRKVTKTNVDYFLTEAGRSLSRTSRDTIYNKVNLSLSKADW